MKIIEPSVELVNAPSYPNILSLIEQAGRTCYKSESKITEDSAEKFVRNILKRGHEAVIEHGVVTVRFVCDRGVSHEIVRHRLPPTVRSLPGIAITAKSSSVRRSPLSLPHGLLRGTTLIPCGKRLVRRLRKTILPSWTLVVPRRKPGLFYRIV